MEEIRDLKERLQEQRPASWENLPDIPLYMDQVLALMGRQTIHFGEEDALTAAMINNYIKDGAAPRAEGKRYNATHLAYLTMICVLKQVLSVKDVALLTRQGMAGGGVQENYDRFCAELSSALNSAADQLPADLEEDELAQTAMHFSRALCLRPGGPADHGDPARPGNGRRAGGKAEPPQPQTGGETGSRRRVAGGGVRHEVAAALHRHEPPRAGRRGGDALFPGHRRHRDRG